jgi:hypothetical protein
VRFYTYQGSTLRNPDNTARWYKRRGMKLIYKEYCRQNKTQQEFFKKQLPLQECSYSILTF